MTSAATSGISAPQPLPSQAQLLETAVTLVSPPAVALKISNLVRSKQSSAQDFADLVATDPNLAARVLRIVNSAYYGFRSEIDTLQRAVVILGVRDLANIALAVTAVRSFSKLGAGMVSVERFWHHAVFVALTSRRLARHFQLAEPDRLFVAGLLHDVGSVAMYADHPELAAWMSAEAGFDEHAVAALERETLGFDHATFGAQLLESWELPATLLDSVGGHHLDLRRATTVDEAAIVAIAERLAAGSVQGAFGNQIIDLEMVTAAIVQDLGDGIDEATLSTIVEDAQTDLAATVDLLGI